MRRARAATRLGQRYAADEFTEPVAQVFSVRRIQTQNSQIFGLNQCVLPHESHKSKVNEGFRETSILICFEVVISDDFSATAIAAVLFKDDGFNWQHGADQN